MTWVDESISAMKRHSHPTYINYLSSNDQESIADAYGDNYARLKSLKSRFDPDNIFHLNRNVLPES